MRGDIVETIADGRVETHPFTLPELFSNEDRIATSSGGILRSIGLYEFDLSALPTGAVITSASLLLHTQGVVSQVPGIPTAPVTFHGFTGDGVLQTSDEAELALTIASGDFKNVLSGTHLVIQLFDLAPVNAVLSDADTTDFFTIQSRTVDFVTFQVDSLETASVGAAPARLELSFITVPEPGSLGFWGWVMVSGFAAGVRRRKMPLR